MNSVRIKIGNMNVVLPAAYHMEKGVHEKCFKDEFVINMISTFNKDIRICQQLRKDFF